MSGDALRAYLRTLYEGQPNALVEIAHQRQRGDEKGPIHRGRSGLFLAAWDIEGVARQIEELGREHNVWVGVVPRRRDPASGEVGGTKEFLAPAHVLWADLDLKDNPDALECLNRFERPPHMLVASGGGYHAYWLIDEPIADAAEVRRANERLVHALGGDRASTDATRILRPPSRNFKYEPPRPVQLVGCEPERPRYSPAELLAGLPDPPWWRPPRSAPARPDLTAADELRRIPPPAYMLALAGRESDRQGFVRCPLPDHEDPGPSCRVYESPEQGWYCYGCGRGGSIYDLWAGLTRRGTRGHEFVELRRELRERFGLSGSPTRPRPRSPRPPVERSRPHPAPAPVEVEEEPPPSQDDGGEETEAVPAASAAAPPPSPPAQAERPGVFSLVPPLALLLPVAKLAGLGGALVVAILVVALAVLGISQPAVGESAFAPSALAREDIPKDYLALYVAAGGRYGLDWTVLAAIGKVETDHGRSPLPGVRSGQNAHGCCAGPMQFWTAPPHPNTWDRFGVDGDGDGRRDPYDPADAIPAAARYLLAAGAPRDWHRAIYAYNHAEWYVVEVRAWAKRYRGVFVPAAPDTGKAELSWPITGRVVSPFGPRWGRLHAGIDIAAPAGTAIGAAAAGRVDLASPVARYGNYLCLRHRPRLSTCYAHLQAYAVREGEWVGRRQLIGHVGCSGRCYGDHLHFEVRLGPPFATPVDPLPYLGGGG